MTLINLLDVITEGRELPAGYDNWAIRTVRADLRSSRGYRYPYPGNIAKAAGPIDTANAGECPRVEGDGICAATTWRGMASGGVTARTLLLVTYKDADVLGGSRSGKLRLRKFKIVDIIDGEALLIASGTRADLTGANLTRANLGGANLGGANLTRADLTGADLGGANLYGANLTRADLGGANLYGANLTRADLGGAYLTRANLGGANLYGADLNGADLGGADLYGANLNGANLNGANLGGANLNGADLGGANLNGAVGYILPDGWAVNGSGTEVKK